jgi:hypothetical protein
MRGSFARANLGIICLTFGSLSLAQVPPVPEQPVASRPVIPVWPGKMPGTARPASQHESTMVVPYDHMHIVRNVTVPTLTLFLPKSNPSKTAVIVAPGGGFRVLAIEAEGYPDGGIFRRWSRHFGSDAGRKSCRAAELCGPHLRRTIWRCAENTGKHSSGVSRCGTG